MIRSWYIKQSEREASALSKCYTTNIYPGGVLLCRSFIKMSCRLSEPDQCPMQWIQGQKTRVLGGGSKGPLSPFNWSKMGLSNIIYCPTENYRVVHPCDCYPHRPHTWIFMNINPDHTIDGYSSSDNSLWISMFILLWLLSLYYSEIVKYNIHIREAVKNYLADFVR